MKVICRCNDNVEDLQVGKIYDCLLKEEEWDNFNGTNVIPIINDKDNVMYVGKWRFDLVEYVQTIDVALKGKEAEDELIKELFEWQPPEQVNHPSHYNQGQFEVIDVIEDWNLGFNLGNAIKYIGRAGHKDDIIQDLEKAAWYLAREIERLKKNK